MEQSNKKRGLNWKLIIPAGCLGSLALMAGFVALLALFVFGMIKSSDVYEEAIAITKANPTVQEQLGTPIEQGMFPLGSINVSGSSGEADLTIPIKGPEGKAKIYVDATKFAGDWTFSALVVEIEESNFQVNLLE